MFSINTRQVTKCLDEKGLGSMRMRADGHQLTGQGTCLSALTSDLKAAVGYASDAEIGKTCRHESSLFQSPLFPIHLPNIHNKM